ncbi:MAG: hypothetical protein ACE5D8_05330 [Fidelibacterota bacterium]
MNKSLSEHIGSTLAHFQDLLDTVFHYIFRVGKEKAKHKPAGFIMKEIGKIGDTFYQTYTKIKKDE